MDKTLRAEIVSEVRRAMTDAMEMYEERWVSKDELCKQMSCFKKRWLEKYGHVLPREQVVITDEDGPHRSGWSYPLHRIQRMMRNGDLKRLVL